jgi:hypothetical protein
MSVMIRLTLFGVLLFVSLKGDGRARFARRLVGRRRTAA